MVSRVVFGAFYNNSKARSLLKIFVFLDVSTSSRNGSQCNVPTSIYMVKLSVHSHNFRKIYELIPCANIEFLLPITFSLKFYELLWNILIYLLPYPFYSFWAANFGACGCCGVCVADLVELNNYYEKYLCWNVVRTLLK